MSSRAKIEPCGQAEPPGECLKDREGVPMYAAVWHEPHPAELVGLPAWAVSAYVEVAKAYAVVNRTFTVLCSKHT